MQIFLGILAILVMLAIIIHFFDWVLIIGGTYLLYQAIQAFRGKIEMKKYRRVLSIIFGSLIFLTGIGMAAGSKVEEISQDEPHHVESQDNDKEQNHEEQSSTVEDKDEPGKEEKQPDNDPQPNRSENKNGSETNNIPDSSTQDQKSAEHSSDEQQETTGDQETDNQGAAPGEPEQDQGIPATVTRVVDGDTLEISMNGKTETVRLLLVDTPETKHPSKPVQPFGPEASQFVKDKLEGKQVHVDVGIEERDHYGRILAYVWIDGETIQEKLLRKGLARTAYLYNDVRMLEEFYEAQDIAMRKEIGIWSIEGYASPDVDDGYHYEEISQDTGVEQSNRNEQVSEEDSSSADEYEYDPWGPDRDCGDFSSWENAQKFFEAREGDPHRLDRDGDGIACDSLK
ncbi:micrococcal nuclease [Melghiribacillus thermohalophilus]|uniref:Micrococcal nuclease n=1 Tax=Melghiribacillus thermohalophilus TaxID=1324956 RepID=A0A4R3N3T8_9BACI|nr:thermonuclease family protein [Melghiribacillus thermohalophilus]TCT21743.1 micrococcal nuclease [Melghiribacillus thermohalophilus]